ncbi:Uncharacterized conserved protein YecT, DUF1311 family [Dyella sp. OK004]|uniref:lysozyme inhibitor LprI family protein n=1 Tax=Dyella sp. OK004 TaxID=1855292 RepID=UPI0008F290FC|nr:lysozyme inhibitor LprI family protein [Dyella sp. OK004]SFS08965.1 Uncharacterized conserved protein YecT, DUF1311 family [Dyella sp. OK004]
MKTLKRFSMGSFVLMVLSMGTMTTASADETYKKCIDKSSDNASWAQCGGQWMQREDDKLNSTWKTLFAKVNGQTKTDLLAEQRLWVSFKEKACKFYANGDWGREGQVLSYPSCQAGLIASRTKDLQDYLKDMNQGGN